MSEQSQILKNIRLIWLLFLGAILVYIATAYFSVSDKNIVISFNAKELTGLYFNILCLISVILIILAFLVYPHILKPKSMDQFMTLKVIQFAFCESAAIFGLLLFFSDNSFTKLIFFSAVSFLLILFLYPRKGLFE